MPSGQARTRSSGNQNLGRKPRCIAKFIFFAVAFGKDERLFSGWKSRLTSAWCDTRLFVWLWRLEYRKSHGDIPGPHLLFCQQYPTGTCVAGNGGV
jgi:hypothetical protein